MDNDLVFDLVLALASGLLMCFCLFSCCLSQMEYLRKDRNKEAPLAIMEDFSQIHTPMPTPGPVVTESTLTENITGMDARRNAVIQLPGAVIPEIFYEETHPDPSNSSRIARPRNYHPSLSVSLPPETILTLSQHVINPECDSPPSYESLFPK